MRKLYEVIHFHLFILFILLLNTCAAGCAVANVKSEDTPTGETLNLQEANNEEIKITEFAENAKKLATSRETSSVFNNAEQPDKDSVLKELSVTKSFINTTEDLMAGDNDELIENEIKKLMLEFGEDEEVPQVFFNEVKAYIHLFQTNYQYKEFINVSLKRSSRYMTSVKGILAKKGIPEDMAYIAFIESGFNPRALSHAGAMGMWQFMPGTARNYSLKVNRSVDERLDPLKSTYAAVDYFHDLLAIFGPRSFLLAMAAYNSGEGRIISCLKGIDNPFEERNFWHIRQCLSKETREYPPKIIAASIIGNNPEAFGFPKIEYQESGEEMEAMTIANLRPRNPKVTPAVYRVQSQSEEDGKLSGKSVKQIKEVKATRQKPLIYTVKKGNTLMAITEFFEVDGDDIKKWNLMKSGKVLAGQRLKIFTDKSFEKITYTVNKGDTMSEISESFSMRASSIITCNWLRNCWDIKRGQSLTFYRKAVEKPVIHVVKKGSSLNKISDRYNVSAKNIMMWNNMKSTTVCAGQKLKIYARVSQEA